MQETKLYMWESNEDFARNMVSVRIETRLMQDTIKFNKELSEQLLDRMLCDGLKKLLDDDSTNTGPGDEVEKNNLQDHPDKDRKVMRELPSKNTRIEGERKEKNIRNNEGFES